MALLLRLIKFPSGASFNGSRFQTQNASKLKVRGTFTLVAYLISGTELKLLCNPLNQDMRVKQ